MVAESAQADASECGQDVALHVALVAAVGAGGELKLLGGKPLAGEVGTEGQRPHGVGPSLLLGGEPGGESFAPVPGRCQRGATAAVPDR